MHIFAPSKPFFYRELKEFNGTTEDYISKIKDIIDGLNSLLIKVTLIIGDNIATQKQAFNGSAKISILGFQTACDLSQRT